MSENIESQLPIDSSQWPELAVKNFGPIIEGKVDLRPLTVFAGPSNTGKSWLATLIYAMTRHSSTDYGLRGFRPRIRSGGIDPDDNALDDFPEHPDAWLQSLRNRKDEALRLTDGDKRVIKSVLERGEEALKKELLRCFGLAEARDLVRELSNEAASVIVMNASAPDAFATDRHLTIGGEGDFSLGVDVMTDKCRPKFMEQFVFILESLLDSDLDDEPARRRARNMRERLLNSLVDNPRFSSAYYLPADRGGIMLAHPVVVGALIQGASRAGLARRSSLPTLSGVHGDFLQQLIELADRSPRHLSPEDPVEDSAHSDLASSLEQNVLKGRIDIKTNGVDYPHFTYRPDGWNRDLSLMSVSSMVSELAPVALYLRHCVEEGDLLILEEPEAHLHPAMQVRLVREIPGWIRQGIRVLITTHSEWVLEEVANLVAAGEGKKEGGLKKQEVGIWLFERDIQTPGSNIREIGWSVDEGGYASDFDDVAMELHNKWAGLVGEEE